MMKVQVLVAAVDKDVKALVEQMKLETDAIIVNQCGEYDYKEFEHKGRRIRCFSMAERGVGLSRNTALMRAEGELLLFSDEDIVFYPGYEDIIEEVFAQNSDADMITFNFKVDPSRATYYNTKPHRIRWYNYGRYPTYAVAARREALNRAGVSFSLLFGGGAKYSNGEDSLFLHDCLKKGLHLYAATAEIGEEIFRESTWFKGYNQKFFYDRGFLYYYLYGRLAGLWSLRFLLAHRSAMCETVSVKQAFSWMRQGIKEASWRAAR